MTRFVIQTYATVPSRLAVRLCLVDAREKDDVAPQSPTRVAVSTMSTLARPRAASAIVPRASSSRARVIAPSVRRARRETIIHRRRHRHARGRAQTPSLVRFGQFGR